MNPEPRHFSDYGQRETTAAHRVLVDLGQVLGGFMDCIVLVGGWVPDVLLEGAEEPHVGSIDVDLALDIGKLLGGRYAKLLKLLLDTGRYVQGDEKFKFVTDVDLKDGLKPVRVEVDFLASAKVRAKKGAQKLMPGFRVLQADGCDAAFREPRLVVISGQMASGAKNSVEFRVASLPDFLVMKAYALKKRDKPKDAYDICYCLTHLGTDLPALARDWKDREADPDVRKAIGFIDEKFAKVDSFGPRQVVEFHDSSDPEERAMQARRAFELVRHFLNLVRAPQSS
jgi:hypothetical protein